MRQLTVEYMEKLLEKVNELTEENNDGWRVERDETCGAWEIDFGENFIYATPDWDDEANSLPVAVANDQGKIIYEGTFKPNWTWGLYHDARKYRDIVNYVINFNELTTVI